MASRSSSSIRGRGDAEDEAERRYQKAVVFRLSNKPEGSICLRVAYVSYDEFKPDPVELNRMAVFQRCLGLEDFHLIVSAINAQLRKTRSISFGFSVAAIVLTFASVAVCVLVHVAGGVSAQVIVVLLHTAVQALLRHRCKVSLNDFLDEHVNQRLRQVRHLYVVFRAVVGGFSQWCEIDFVSTNPNTNPLAHPHRNNDDDDVGMETSGNRGGADGAGLSDAQAMFAMDAHHRHGPAPTAAPSNNFNMEQEQSVRAVVLGVDPFHRGCTEGSVKSAT